MILSVHKRKREEKNTKRAQKEEIKEEKKKKKIKKNEASMRLGRRPSPGGKVVVYWYDQSYDMPR